ncbi:MAG: CHASE2 domain-containing protein [Synechococcales bacterium]|nr:CHASE2 domain-containing protein [Synechococcales bacterium]
MQDSLLGGRYKITKVLGAGGFGQTYLAEDLQRPDGFVCVIKQFKPASKDTKFLEIARRLFDTEVKTLERLGQHPQIPSFYDAFEESREFYLVQEFIDGQSLSDELAQCRQLSEAQVIELLRDVLGILEFVHHHHVIHRDVKPENLIRRREDGKIVLIDFGAVKEIRTQMVDPDGRTQLTVGIGTEGYTPNEQLAGRPRYNSDVYALGVTAIQALTGLQPFQIEDDPDTCELIWQHHASVSTGLALVLERMVRYHVNQRYQSATEVLHSLDRLADLPTDFTDLMDEPSAEPGTLIDRLNPLGGGRRWWATVIRNARQVAIASIAVSGVLLGVRHLGWLQALELVAYDRMVQLHPEHPPDPRLLVVGISEADLQVLNRPTPSDAAVAQVMAELMRHKPRVLGLALHRDLPQDPGRDELLAQLQSDRAIAILNLGTSDTNRIPPPPGMDLDRVGFNDFPIDPDGVVRRNLLIGTDEDSNTYFSFALKLAMQYLEAEGVEMTSDPKNPALFRLGQTTFHPLTQRSGGYQTLDAGGYQIILNYRNASQVAEQVAFTDVLNGNIDPSLVKDRIVLIGTTATSSKDLFYTPYSGSQQTEHQMTGVIVHAQMVSQLLSAVSGERSLVWFFPEWAEILWILGWAIAGGAIVCLVRHPFWLGIGSGVLVLVIVGTGYVVFSYQGWIPSFTPALAALLSGAAAIAYRTYQTQRQQQDLTDFLRQNRADTLTLTDLASRSTTARRKHSARLGRQRDS